MKKKNITNKNNESNMVVDESSTKVLFSHPLSPKIDDFELVEHTEVRSKTNKIYKKQNKVTKNNKKNINILIIIIIILFISLIGYIFLSKKLIINNIQRYLINTLKSNKYEFINYKMDIKVTGNELFNVLNNSHIDGSYVSENDKFKNNINLTSSYEDTINMFYYSDNESGYYYDPYLSEQVIKLDKNYDLSINSLNKNIVSFEEQLLKNNMYDLFKLKLIDENNVLSLTITNKNIDEIINKLKLIKLDKMYQDILDKIINDMNNKDKYINTSINLYSKMFGNLNKIEIISNKTLVLNIYQDNIDLQLIDNDTKYDLKINNNKIIYEKYIGSRKDTNVTIDYKYNIEHQDNIEEIDKKNIVTDTFNINKKILQNRSKLELYNIFCDIINKSNIVNMSLENDDYIVFYNVPDKYNVSNYSGKTLKRYNLDDSVITYSLKDNNILDYIDEQYQKEVDSNLYKNVTKKESNQIISDYKEFNYKIITKSFDNAYSDYNSLKSTLYLWYQIDNNNTFLIEYQFEGEDISESDIKKLLVVQVGKK